MKNVKTIKVKAEIFDHPGFIEEMLGLVAKYDDMIFSHDGRKHFQGLARPEACFKCKSKNILVQLTKDNIWGLKCKDCGLEAWY